jgi:hypothetical protein
MYNDFEGKVVLDLGTGTVSMRKAQQTQMQEKISTTRQAH